MSGVTGNVSMQATFAPWSEGMSPPFCSMRFSALIGLSKKNQHSLPANQAAAREEVTSL